MSVEHRSETTTASPMLVPRRRLPVRLQLADGSAVSGEAYVALARAGAQERLLDRLNDGSERFLPIAAHGRHLLVRKTAIVTAWTLDESEVRAGLETPRYREIPVEVAMSVGPVIEGCLLADTDPLHDRALDNLNRVVEPFVALLGREAITLVNTAHVVSVVERATQRID